MLSLQVCNGDLDAEDSVLFKKVKQLTFLFVKKLNTIFLFAFSSVVLRFENLGKPSITYT